MMEFHSAFLGIQRRIIFRSVNLNKSVHFRYLCFLGLFLFIAMPSVQGQLSISENGRYLVKPDGTPLLWLGDTGWGLFQKITRKDVDYYLKQRADQGFTVIHAAVAH